jgi:hypothetical protein
MVANVLEECIASIFRVKVIHSFETLVTIYKTTWHQDPEDHNRYLHCHKNL